MISIDSQVLRGQWLPSSVLAAPTCDLGRISSVFRQQAANASAFSQRRLSRECIYGASISVGLTVDCIQSWFPRLVLYDDFFHPLSSHSSWSCQQGIWRLSAGSAKLGNAPDDSQSQATYIATHYGATGDTGYLNCSLWIVEGNWNTWSKLTQDGVNVQTPRTQSGGGFLTLVEESGFPTELWVQG